MNISEETRKMIEEKADYYFKLYKICQDSLKNNNVTAACRKEEFPVREFRNRVLNNINPKQKIKISKEKYKNIRKEIMTPEEKLYRAIFLVEDEDDFDLPDIPDEELEQTVQFVVNSLSDFKDREIIKRRFFENKSLKETAEEFGVSKARIQQLEARAIRRLRHPKRTRILILGKRESEARDNRIKEMQKEMENYEKRIEEIKNELKLKKEELERIDRTVYHQDIEVLNLSIRAYNILKRYGINKISEIKENEGELIKIRGLTKKLINEISQKMESVGILLNEE